MNPENELIFIKIRSLITETVGLQEDEVKPESHFFNDLGCDSIMLAELIMMLEDEFNIRITDQEAEKIRLVADAMNYIEKSIAAKAC